MTLPFPWGYVEGDVASTNIRHAKGEFYAQNVVGNSFASRFVGDGAVMVTANEGLSDLPIVVGLAGVATVGVPGSSGYQYISTPTGTVVAVPANWVGRVADNGKGIVFQNPTATHSNGDMIRIMDPTAQYPKGYVVYSNPAGQNLDVNGNPTGKQNWHIPLDYKGLLPKWPK